MPHLRQPQPHATARGSYLNGPAHLSNCLSPRPSSLLLLLFHLRIAHFRLCSVASPIDSKPAPTDHSRSVFLHIPTHHLVLAGISGPSGCRRSEVDAILPSAGRSEVGWWLGPNPNIGLSLFLNQRRKNSRAAASRHPPSKASQSLPTPQHTAAQDNPAQTQHWSLPDPGLPLLVALLAQSARASQPLATAINVCGKRKGENFHALDRSLALLSDHLLSSHCLAHDLPPPFPPVTRRQTTQTRRLGKTLFAFLLSFMCCPTPCPSFPCCCFV